MQYQQAVVIVLRGEITWKIQLLVSGFDFIFQNNLASEIMSRWQQ